MEVKMVCGYRGSNDKLFDTELEAKLNLKEAEFKNFKDQVDRKLREAIDKHSYADDKIQYQYYKNGNYPYHNIKSQKNTLSFDGWRASSGYRSSNPFSSYRDMLQVILYSGDVFVELGKQAAELQNEVRELRSQVRGDKEPEPLPRQIRRQETMIDKIKKFLGL